MGEDGRGIGYSPAIDGIRALAVVAVVAFHADLGVAPGGFLGVSVFFTLSGFLITLLLVSEHRTSGRIDLRRFYARRARRLLPAAWLCVLGVLAAFPLWSTAQQSGLRLDALGAVGNVANWRFAVAESSYQDLLDRSPSPLAHFWSLAIEEQMYLLVPVVVVVCLRRNARTLGVVAAAGAIASTAAMWLTTDFDLAYNGTHTRAAELLTGAVLAVAIDSPAGRRVATSPRGRRWVATAGTVGLACIAAGVVAVEIDDGSVIRFGLIAISLASCAVVAMAWLDVGVARWLALPPLAALGRVSYGVYLYHWPIFVLLTPERVGVDGVALLSIRLALLAVVTAASSSFVERPIRSGRALTRPRVATASATALVIALVTAVTSLPTRAPDADAALLASGRSEAIRFGDDQDVEAGATANDATPTASTSTVPTDTSPIPGAAPGTVTTESTSPVPATPSILVVGDDGDALTALADLDVGLVDALQPGCPFTTGEEIELVTGERRDISGCEPTLDRARTVARFRTPDLVVVALGRDHDGSIRQADQIGFPDDDDLTGWSQRATPTEEQIIAFADHFAALDIPVVHYWSLEPTLAGFQFFRLALAHDGVVGNANDVDSLRSLVSTTLEAQRSPERVETRIKVMVQGDSTSLLFASALHEASTEFDVLWTGHNFCPFARARAVRLWPGREPEVLDCPDFAAKQPPHLASFEPDVIVVMVGPPAHLEHFYPGVDGGHLPGSPGYQAFHDSEMETFLALVGPSTPVLVADAPMLLDGDFSTPTLRDPAGHAGWNGQIQRWADQHDQVTVFDYAGPLTAYEAAHGAIRDDGVHVDTHRIVEIVETDYIDQIVAAASTTD